MANDVSYFYVRDDPTKYAFDDADAEERITDESERAETAEQTNATNIGILSELTTTAKDNLVAAINEVDGKIPVPNVVPVTDYTLSNVTAESTYSTFARYGKVGILTFNGTLSTDYTANTVVQIISGLPSAARGVVAPCYFSSVGNRYTGRVVMSGSTVSIYYVHDALASGAEIAFNLVYPLS